MLKCILGNGLMQSELRLARGTMAPSVLFSVYSLMNTYSIRVLLLSDSILQDTLINLQEIQ